MANFIKESIETPIKYEYDVCVCGGGVAGISAALAAARAGAKTVLLERSFMLGGLATAGLITIYLPLCDGMGHQVSFGIAEELLHLSIKHGYEGRYAKAWFEGGSFEERRDGRRFEVQFNPQLFAISAEQLLRAEGVEIIYGATVVAAPTEDGKITDIVIEGKSGREAIKISRSVVDTTGDADICKLSGAKTENYKRGNLLAAWCYTFGGGEYNLVMKGCSDITEEEEKAGKRVNALVDRRFSGLDTKENSEMVELSHDFILKTVLEKRESVPDTLPVTIATIPQVRMTRRIAGAYTLDESEVHKRFEDSVGMVSDWRKRGPVFEIPFRALYGESVKNLITAGRCISVTDAMWDITRVIPDCAVTGEAAGTAAAMSDDFASLDVKALQDELEKRGVVLHEN